MKLKLTKNEMEDADFFKSPWKWMEMVNNYICDICGMNCGFLWVMSHPIINGYSELRMKLGMSYWAIDLLDLWRKGNRQPIFGQTYGDP